MIHKIYIIMLADSANLMSNYAFGIMYVPKCFLSDVTYIFYKMLFIQYVLYCY